MSWAVRVGLLTIGGLTAWGCASALSKPGKLPAPNGIELGQLVVHSDFPLPPHHRLLDDLVAEREELLAKLTLVASDEPIHVYLFDSDSEFQTYIERHYPQFPVRRAFFVQTDTRLAVYAKWGDRVAEDLRHEVAHGYLHAIVPTIPLWLDEGLAEYFEVPRGQSGLNRPHVQLLLSQIYERGWRPNLERLEALQSAAEMSQLDYAEAWAWVHFLIETDPPRRQLVTQYLQALRKEGKAEPLSAPLRRAFPHPEQALTQYVHALR